VSVLNMQLPATLMSDVADKLYSARRQLRVTISLSRPARSRSAFRPIAVGMRPAVRHSGASALPTPSSEGRTGQLGYDVANGTDERRTLSALGGRGQRLGRVLKARKPAYVDVDHQRRRDVGAAAARLEALQLVQRAVQHAVQARLVLREQLQPVGLVVAQPAVRQKLGQIRISVRSTIFIGRFIR
jgi:hypothetical protein